nr:unnamed protein product [Spirometra erinaceieuropaei]
MSSGAASDTLHGPDGFVEKGREVEVGVDLQPSQTGDVGVADGERAVENASEDTAVGAEKRSNCFGWRTVDSLHSSIQLIPFFAIRVPLDFFGFASRPASRPAILHHPQPLMHEAETTAEGRFVVVGKVVDIGFVQAVLPDEKFVGDIIAMVEPVLMLAMCAAENSHGSLLNHVHQLTPLVRQGSVLVHSSGDYWKFLTRLLLLPLRHQNCSLRSTLFTSVLDDVTDCTSLRVKIRGNRSENRLHVLTDCVEADIEPTLSSTPPM